MLGGRAEPGSNQLRQPAATAELPSPADSVRSQSGSVTLVEDAQSARLGALPAVHIELPCSPVLAIWNMPSN